MDTPSKLDTLIVRVIATLQLLLSLAGFPLIVIALNYGGASANPGLLPMIFLYLFYGVVTAIFLYSALTLARVFAFFWHAVLVGRVITAWALDDKPVPASAGFLLLISISTLALLYLAITSLAHSHQQITAAVRQSAPAARICVLAFLILIPFALARFHSYANSITYQESLLHSSSQETRCAAAKELAEKGSAGASALPALKSMMDNTQCVEFGSVLNSSQIEKIGGIEPLIDVMKSGSSTTRHSVAWYLRNTAHSHPASTAQLRDAFAAGLGDEDAGVREASALALGELWPLPIEFVPQLINLLNDASPDVRVAAVEAIGNMKSLDGLQQALANSDSRVRAAASERLRTITRQEK
jgi:hypothetical protein